MKPNLRQTAYHEAGHAVAFQLGGNPLIAVDIHQQDDGRLGTCAPCEDCSDVESMRANIIGTYAGYAADVLSGGDKDIARGTACLDFDDAERQIARLGEGDEDYWIGQAEEFALDHWKAIQAVAEELLQRERLIGDEVEIIVAYAEGDEEADIDAYRRFRKLI